MPKEWTPEEREAAAARTRAHHEAQRQQRASELAAVTPEEREAARLAEVERDAVKVAEWRDERASAAAASDPPPAEPEEGDHPVEPELPVPPVEPPPPPAAASEPEPEPIPMAPIAHEGTGAPASVVDVPNAVMDEIEDRFGEPVEGMGNFERFLAAQDAETRDLLTDIELRVIYETETKRAAEEKKAAARKGALARAQRHVRIVAGLIPAEAIEASARLERLSRKVSWTVNMPEAGNSGMLTDVGVRIDGRLLQHGETITGTLAQYESYREIEWRAHQGELDFQGKGKMSRLRQSAIRSLNYEGPRL